MVARRKVIGLSGGPEEWTMRFASSMLLIEPARNAGLCRAGHRHAMEVIGQMY
ncbi:hypothetical protein [Azospirillum argentinense]|uniref:Uncharacterized protein n=1 Tax=Azospirillum argentinense TaxID=2970906 RepID=A0A5B0KXQ4_9PROT|nr:hypothetical protein FH063_004651 [Azospirillum argentinense]